MNFLQLPLEIIYNIFLNMENAKQYSYLSEDVRYLLNNFYNSYHNQFNNLLPKWEQNIEQLCEILIRDNNENGIRFLLNNYKNFTNLLYSLAYGAIVNKNTYWLNYVKGKISIDIEIILFYLAKYNKIDEIDNILRENTPILKYYDEIASGASAGGHLQLLQNIINNYAVFNFEKYALIASKYNKENIVLYILDNFNINVNNIAKEAVKYNNNNILKILPNIVLNNNELTTIALMYDNVDFIKNEKLSNKYVNSIINVVINNNSIKIFNYFMKNYNLNYNVIGLHAAEVNNTIMVISAITYGATNFNEMAIYAAYNKNNKLVTYLVKNGASNVNKLAKIAIKTDNNILLNELLNYGVNNFHELISVSLKYKNNKAENIIDKFLMK